MLAFFLPITLHQGVSQPPSLMWGTYQLQEKRKRILPASYILAADGTIKYRLCCSETFMLSIWIDPTKSLWKTSVNFNTRMVLWKYICKNWTDRHPSKSGDGIMAEIGSQTMGLDRWNISRKRRDHWTAHKYSGQVVSWVDQRNWEFWGQLRMKQLESRVSNYAHSCNVVYMDIRVCRASFLNDF